MSDAIAIAMIGGLPATFAAITGLVVSIAALRKGQSNGVKADTIIDKAAEIHTLTDGNLTKVSAALDEALKKIDAQGKLIEALKDRR